MRDVFALVFRGDLAKLDQLLGLRVKGGWINQRSANPQRARFHFLAHQLAHLVELFRRRLFIFEPDHVLTNRRRTDERRHIARHATLFQILQILRERVPFDVVLDVDLLDEPCARALDRSPGPSIRLRP